MQPVPTSVSDHATLAQVGRALTSAPSGVLPVTDTVLGVVTAPGVFEALADGRQDDVAAPLAAEIPVTVSVDDPIGTSPRR